LEYPDFVHSLCIDFYGRAVLVKQYRHGVGDFSLELPGGCVDPTDVDPISAAMRELWEETGYVGEAGRLLASLTVDPAKLSNRLHLVLVENARPTGERRLDLAEDLETILIPGKELAGLALGGKIINAAHVGMIMIGLEAAGM
jgi:8-oxo-dGTP pyrophosphatase MutT (NUDIX family)